MEHVFEDIEGKAKPIEPQGKALKGKGAKCMLDMGSMSMTASYVPLKSHKGHVRKALALAHHSGVGLTLMTWSARVVRDVDLLPAINQKTKCVVQTTQTTCDENVLSLLEKNATFPLRPGPGGLCRRLVYFSVQRYDALDMLSTFPGLFRGWGKQGAPVDMRKAVQFWAVDAVGLLPFNG